MLAAGPECQHDQFALPRLPSRIDCDLPQPRFDKYSHFPKVIATLVFYYPLGCRDMRRVTEGAAHLRRLPSEAEGVEVPVAVIPLQPEHATWWHSELQPTIAQDTTRADREWNWPLIASVFFANTAASEPFEGFCLAVLRDGRVVPCGLLLLLKKFPYLADRRRHSVYVWYLSNAPTDVLMARGYLTASLTPKMIASALVDVALCYSFTTRLEGRMSLYAAVEGGAKLFEWYRDKRGMTPLAPSKPLPEKVRDLEETENDGRFFYYTTASGILASKRLDDLRR